MGDKICGLELKKPIAQFIFFTFLIAWGCEGVLIVGGLLGLLDGTVGTILHFVLIAMGAGFAPAYSIFIVLMKHEKIRGLKEYISLLLKTPKVMWTISTTVIFGIVRLVFYFVVSQYVGPWYLFIVLLPLTVLGGGFEELGWRGFLQPALEEKLSFIPACLLVGVIWAVWHLPLWIVPNTSQSTMNFLMYLAHCVVFSFVLGALLKMTNSVIAVVIAHAWDNVLGGVFTIQMLTGVMDTKLAIAYLLQIALAIAVVSYINKKKKSLRTASS